MRVTYALVAVLAAGLVVWTRAQEGPCGSVQMANQLVSGAALAILATGASLGLCRVPAVRDVCTMIAVWATYSPIFLPGRLSCVDVVIGIVLCLAAGCAAESYADIERSEDARAPLS